MLKFCLLDNLIYLEKTGYKISGLFLTICFLFFFAWNTYTRDEDLKTYMLNFPFKISNPFLVNQLFILQEACNSREPISPLSLEMILCPLPNKLAWYALPAKYPCIATDITIQPIVPSHSSRFNSKIYATFRIIDT